MESGFWNGVQPRQGRSAAAEMKRVDKDSGIGGPALLDHVPGLGKVPDIGKRHELQIDGKTIGPRQFAKPAELLGDAPAFAKSDGADMARAQLGGVFESAPVVFDRAIVGNPRHFDVQHFKTGLFQRRLGLAKHRLVGCQRIDRLVHEAQSDGAKADEIIAGFGRDMSCLRRGATQNSQMRQRKTPCHGLFSFTRGVARLAPGAGKFTLDIEPKGLGCVKVKRRIATRSLTAHLFRSGPMYAILYTSEYTTRRPSDSASQCAAPRTGKLAMNAIL